MLILHTLNVDYYPNIHRYAKLLTFLRCLNTVKCSKLCYRIGGSCNNFCNHTINDESKVKFNFQSTAADVQSL